MESIRKHKYLLRSSARLEVRTSYSPAICNSHNGADEKGIGSIPQGSKRKRITEKATTTQLPEELVTEILPRLPVKSLFRFKCVCKHWYDLIRSPNFITTHDKITSLKNKLPIFFRHHDPYSYSYSSPVTVSVWVPYSPLEFELTIPPRSEPLFVGCYNGLVCLCLSHRTHHRFLLWNPATTQSRIIPPITGRNAHTKYYSGLCFDSVANTHKIVRMRNFSKIMLNMNVPEDKVHVIAYVYTLNDDYWRTKKLFVPCRLPNGGKMSKVTHLMKFMCWIVRGRSGGDKDKYILCLDMVDEEFKIIDLPCARHIHHDTELVDYKGSIAVCVWKKSAKASRGGGCCFDLWVLNDYGGTNQSWCKQLTWTPKMPDIAPADFYYSESFASVN